MKNKVIALSLLITAMSVTSAFGATTDCISNVMNKSNSYCNILTEGINTNKAYGSLYNYTCGKVNISNAVNSILEQIKQNCNQSNNNSTNNGITVIKPGTSCPNSGTNNDNIVTNPGNGSNNNNNVIKPENNGSNSNNNNVIKPGNNGSNNNNNNNNNIIKPENDGSNNNSNNTNSSVSSYEQQVVSLVNAERAKYGLSALTLDTSVSKVARIKSQDMATNNYFSHTSPTYGNAGSMLSQFGISYTAYGENIAAGQKTPEAVVTAWMNSSGHRANILSSTFTKIGVGYATNSQGKAYWTQMFTR